MPKPLRLRHSLVLFALCFAIASGAMGEATFKTLVNFNGANGTAPSFVALVQGTDGNLYGTTSFGGKNNAGTVFKMTPAGALTTIYSFCSKPKCADGAYPEVGLTLATNGNFYGTTQGGGFDCSLSAVTPGCGTVFEITPEGELTTLYTFCKGNGNCVDGANPKAPLIQATNGDFYGTTFYGGNSNDAGTLFQLTAAGEFTTLYTFCSEDGIYCHDGANPGGLMVQVPRSGGDHPTSAKAQAPVPIYATTDAGGAVHYDGSPCGEGMAYHLEPEPDENFVEGFYWECEYDDAAKGAYLLGYTLFHVFGKSVEADSTSDASTLFGAASGGGANLSGVVYELTTSGAYTVLHSFCSEANCADGAYPASTASEGSDGNFYGTTAGGNGNSKCPGLNGCGTVYQITPTGTLTTLHSFEVTDGEDPDSMITQATNGTFYGLTSEGGTSGDGTIFSISTGLGPFVQTVPTMGAVGTAVMILGTDLTGASAVTFNGKAAEFKVVSATEITTTVPIGATTGSVEVTTPSGTLESFAFQVL
jgi:uncharacterized repeat protein (TIGR03803 family)